MTVIQVGDTVIYDTFPNSERTVIAERNGWLWMEHDNGSMATGRMENYSKVQRVPAVGQTWEFSSGGNAVVLAVTDEYVVYEYQRTGGPRVRTMENFTSAFRKVS